MPVDKETVDLDFIIFTVIGLVLTITTWLVGQAIGAETLYQYSVLYATLSIATLAGTAIYTNIYNVTYKPSSIWKTVTASIITFSALIVSSVLFYGASDKPQMIQMPIIGELPIPEKIGIEVELTPGLVIAKGYIGLAEVLGVPTNILLSAILMLPVGFSESLFQTVFPGILESGFGRGSAGETISVLLSNLSFGILHGITYGFNPAVFVGSTIGGMIMSLTYRIHRSETGLAFGHILYNWAVLFLAYT